MTVGERIEILIRKKKIKKVEFAAAVNIDQSYVTKIIKGTSNASSRLLNDISQKFGVRLEWLETGDGEMFVECDTSILEQLEASGVLTPKGRELIEIYLKMPPATQDLIADAIAAAAKLYPRKSEDLKSETGIASSVHKPDNELTREEKHAQLDVELDAEEAARKRGTSTSLASTGTNGMRKKIGNSP